MRGRPGGPGVLRAYWTAAPLLVLGLAALAGLRPEWVERAAEHWDDRWSRRLAEGERLLSLGRFDEAAAYLGRLDAAFPAQFVKHKRDRERERLLVALARAQLAAGREKRAVEACRKLVAFDPRNHANHVELGRALAADGDEDLAAQAFEAALAIHPAHREATERLIELHFEAGRFEEVARRFEVYLEAVVFARLRITIDDRRFEQAVRVDGQRHTLSIPLDGAAVRRVRLGIAGGEWAIAPGEVRIRAPQRWGRPASADGTTRLAATAWRATGMRETGEGAFVCESADSALELAAGESAAEAASIEIDVRVLPPLGREAWSMVQKSYHNLLADERLAQAAPRVSVR